IVNCLVSFSKIFATTAPTVKLTMTVTTEGTAASALICSVAKVADRAVLQIPTWKVTAITCVRGNLNHFAIKYPPSIGIVTWKNTIKNMKGKTDKFSAKVGCALDTMAKMIMSKDICDTIELYG